jgi:penicillin-binding protein 2
MSDALQVSSDVFFYNLGRRADNAGGDPIQDWAFRLGLGGPTGIDIPSEFSGLIPTPEWRNELFKEELTDRPWSEGDVINLSIGQGDVQVTPLQLAVAYATLANGGDVVRPHIANQVEDPTGRVVEEINPEPRRHVDISASTRRTVMDGLHRAAMEEGGTSYPIFGGWPIEIAGKTGTAERGTLQGDQSWYVGMAPYENPEIVVVATVEQGGFGADTAAPAVSEILQAYFPDVADKIKPAPATSSEAYE